MTENIAAHDTPVFAEWCIVELFGHQRYAGRVSQAEWPPGFARLEVPATDGHEPMTQLLSPQSIYRLTPTTEAIALAVAAQCRPEPVSRWELPAAKDPFPAAFRDPEDRPGFVEPDDTLTDEDDDTEED